MSEDLIRDASRLEGWFEEGAWPVAGLMALSLSPVLLIDLESHIFYANPAFCRRWEYDDESQLIGHRLGEVVRIEGNAVASTGLDAVEWRQTETTAITSFDEEFNVDMAVGVLRDRRGNPKACMISFVDVSERCRLEREVSESFQEFICLYTVGSIAENTKLTLADIGREVADLLPVSCRDPENTSARVRLYGEDYFTSDYCADAIRICRDIKVNDTVCGEIEICYHSNYNGNTGYKFSDKERMLLEAVASRLGRIVELRETRENLLRSEEVLRWQNRQLTVLNRISGTLNSSLDMAQLLDTGLETLQAEMGLQGVRLDVLIDSDGKWQTAATTGCGNEIDTNILTADNLSKINCDIADSMEIVVSANKPGSNLVSTPVQARGALLGILHVVGRDELVSANNLDIMMSVGRLFGSAVESARMVGRIKEQSVTDELTALPNRRRFYEMLAQEADRAQRYQRSFALALIDLDGFKECNDTYGHDTGDKVLRDFAALLTKELRRSDTPFRQGGDEFAVILTETEGDAAARIIQRIRGKWQRMYRDTLPELKQKLSFSAGIGIFPVNAENIDELIRIVDSALYISKRGGKGITTMVSDIDDISGSIMHAATGQQVYALAATVDAKDPNTYGHSERVAELSVRLGKALGLSKSQLAELKAASLLHDIGKLGIPDSILTKPGKLTDDEFEYIKRHPGEGARIIGMVKELSGLVPAVRHHHERWDGAGYPDGLKGKDIPLMARIITVADSYDAITSARTYKNAMSGATAIKEIRNGAGSQFDPEMAQVFIDIIGDEG